jgi:AcrR family transcriptional regulator
MRTRESILATAAALATVEGLDRVSIGDLAEHIGISKSGLYAHFRSKEALQLATIEHAWAIFDREVVDPALTAAPGRATVIALMDAFTDHLERRVFPGGCFFAATLAEMHLRPGPVTSRLTEFQVYWLGLLRSNIVLAQEAGEIPTDEDPEQLTFEIESHVVHAHMTFPGQGDKAVLRRARDAVRRRLGVMPGV